MYARLFTLYAYDSLRGDGYPVRLDRLGMLSLQTAQSVPLVWALCWTMEIAFYVAYYRPNQRAVACATFWLSYLVIVHTVTH